MTEHELQMLQRWMQEKFEDRDRESLVFVGRLDKLESTMQRIDGKVTEFEAVASDIKDLATFFRESRDTWQNVAKVTSLIVTKRGGLFIVGAIFAVNWLAALVRALPWPW